MIMNYRTDSMDVPAAVQAKLAQGAASTLVGAGPGQIAMLTKRSEELAAYGKSVSERAHGALNRILGAVPENEVGAGVNGRIGGELDDLEMALGRIERAIAELDGAARRLEGL
jgi:hypothetical protein